MGTKRSVVGPKLIVEDYPAGYTGYKFITYIKYRDSGVVAIVDNATDTTIKAYVLDMCSSNGISEEGVIGVAADWFNDPDKHHSISFEFAIQGISAQTSKILRTFNTNFVTRVIGVMPRVDMHQNVTTRRKRRKSIDKTIQIIRK